MREETTTVVCACHDFERGDRVSAPVCDGCQPKGISACILAFSEILQSHRRVSSSNPDHNVDKRWVYGVCSLLSIDRNTEIRQQYPSLDMRSVGNQASKNQPNSQTIIRIVCLPLYQLFKSVVLYTCVTSSLHLTVYSCWPWIKAGKQYCYQCCSNQAWVLF